MATSPGEFAGTLVTLSLFSNGQLVNSTYQIQSVRVHHEVNRISSAVVELIDGNVSNQDFVVSDSGDFIPGSKIKITAGYESKEEIIFEGIVLKHAIKCLSSGSSHMTFECKNDSVKMTIGRKNEIYTETTDSDIISKIISNYGLSADVESTSNQLKEVVQYYSTDWDFMLSRAEINGMYVVTNGSKVTVGKPKVSSDPVLKVTFGADIHEFELELDARYQLPAVKITSWDMATQQIIQENGSAPSLNAQGNISASTLAAVIGLTSYDLQTDAPTLDGAIKSWADAQLLKSGLSRIKGTVSFQGSSLIMPGDLIELEGVGDRFSGKAYIGSVTHVIENGDWVTETGIGLSEEWHIERKEVSAPLASGLLPGIAGLHIGIVKKLDQDPNGEYKIQITIPVMQSDADGIWARLASFYHSNGFGSFFLPEISDEVIVGFLNNDPSHPVILGSVYSSKNKPPYEFTAENNTKAIVTRSKIKIEIDDDKKIITIQTPANNKIVMSDDQKSILVSDQNNNTIELNSSGISMNSPKDIQITAKGKISLDAVSEIDINAKADVKVSGLNINNSANVGFVGKGNATAELSASGQTTVKGAIVMIN